MREKNSHMENDHSFRDLCLHSFQCDLCGEHFESRIQMEKHRYQESLIKKANETALIHCELCDEKFTSHMIWKQHVQIVHSKGKKRKLVANKVKNTE